MTAARPYLPSVGNLHRRNARKNSADACENDPDRHCVCEHRGHLMFTLS
jgi:hypothetical protein